MRSPRPDKSGLAMTNGADTADFCKEGIVRPGLRLPLLVLRTQSFTMGWRQYDSLGRPVIKPVSISLRTRVRQRHAILRRGAPRGAPWAAAGGRPYRAGRS